MVREWALVAADFRREYHMPADQVAGLGTPEFLRLLRGLSEQARWWRALREAPQNVYTPADLKAAHTT